ncbi:MAG: competence protein CoiA family protein, partial [Flavobacteriaceae bacterium]
AEVIAKCGDKNIHHWAHKSNKECPHWWENETKWHRDWKNQFQEDWKEVIHISETGEKHIADIKTPNGLVVEFQHSYIKPEEILARNNFYKNIIWIVDGKRRPTDEKKFEEALEWRGWDSSRLLKDWTIFPKPVFFDFGKPLLWGGCQMGFLLNLKKRILLLV